MALLAATLTACTPSTESATATVGAEGFEITLGEVTATAPAGVAPEGTTVTLATTGEQMASGLDAQVSSVGTAVSLELAGGLQPAAPIQLRFAIDEAAIADAEWSSDSTLLILSESADGTIGLTETVREGNVLTATTDHLSIFRPVQFDIGALLTGARDFLLQSLGVEYPKPDCVEKTATTASGVEYSMIPAGPIWPCISADGDTITVDLYAATSMPYRALSAPPVVGGTVASPDGQGILMALSNKYVPSISGGTILGAGASARFVFGADDPPQYFEAQQDAHMLIGAVLLNLLGIILPPLGGGDLLGKIGQLDCLSGVVNTGTSPTLDAGTAAEFVRTFLACAGTVAGASYGIRLALGLIGAVPALFSGVVIGVINEITGDSVVTVPVQSRVSPWPITFDGIGPIVVGATTWDDLEARRGFEGYVNDDMPPLVCASGGWFDSSTIYDGVSALADSDDASPGAVDVVGVNSWSRDGVAASVPTQTAEGIGLGATEAQVRAAYPNARVQPVYLDQEATEYTIEDGAGRAIKFSVRDGVLYDISVGTFPQIDYVEGCA